MGHLFVKKPGGSFGVPQSLHLAGGMSVVLGSMGSALLPLRMVRRWVGQVCGPLGGICPDLGSMGPMSSTPPHPVALPCYLESEGRGLAPGDSGSYRTVLLALRLGCTLLTGDDPGFRVRTLGL